MWMIIKYKRNEYNVFLNEIKKKLGNNYEIYSPKFNIKKFRKGRFINHEIKLLDDYLFLFHPSFSQEEKISNMKFTKGLKYFLNNFIYSQNEIQQFIDKCKKFENNEGYLLKSFLELEVSKYYRFKSGPFENKIFKLISFDKNKLSILVNGLKAKINRENFLYSIA